MDTVRGFPLGDLRVSDAERDLALAELSEHYQSGRLTAGEFDERSGRALRARTGDQLRALFTDLPPARAAVVIRGGCACEARPVSATRVVVLCVLVAIVIGNVLVNLRLGQAGPEWLPPFIALATAQ
jgi:Domain of unknown function (DUF1707)